MSSVLIMTRDSCADSLDEDLVFLGRWCGAPNYERLSRGRVLPHPWNDRDAFASAFVNYEADYEQALSVIAESLNTYHGTNISLRAWRILVGPWLGLVLGSWVETVTTVSAAERTGIDSFAQLPAVPSADLLAGDFVSAMNLVTTSDLWSNHVHGVVAKTFTSMKEVPVWHSGLCLDANRPARSRMPASRFNVWKLAAKRLTMPLKTVVYGVDMSKWHLAELHLRLGLVPGSFTGRLDATALQTIARPDERPKWLNVDRRSWPGPDALAELVEAALPTAYLEDFETIRVQLKDDGLEQPPRCIYTVGGLNSDEKFKAYVASAVDRGARLVVGQHGGGYGIYRHMHQELHELKVADTFLSWGWTAVDGPGVVTPMGIVKADRHTHRRRLASQRTLGIVLITQNYPLRGYYPASHPIGDQWYEYLDEQFAFVEQLSEAAQSQLSIRLYPEDYGRDQRGLWQAAFPGVRFAPADRPFAEIRSRAQLLVVGYNSTEFLLSFSSRTPTVTFFSPTLWEVREQVEEALERLRQVGMLHNSGEEAATFVEATIGSADKWWSSNQVVAARNHAARLLARRPRSLVGELVPHLT